jgi:hypothetical protein
MHPISRLRLEEYVAVIRLKELPVGLRVISAEASSIESLPEEQKNEFLKDIITLSVKKPNMICCLAIYKVEAIDAAIGCSASKGYVWGDYSALASIQKLASTANDLHVKLIKKLNKEV